MKADGILPRGRLSPLLLSLLVALSSQATDMAFHFLKRVEGFSPVAYKEPSSSLSIGYGFNDADLVRRGTITRADADAELRRRIAEIRARLRKVMHGRVLTKNQEAAIVSFAYNVGWGRFARSRLLSLLRNRASTDTICKEMLKWCKVTVADGSMKDSVGLYIRRKKETALFAGIRPKRRKVR